MRYFFYIIIILCVIIKLHYLFLISFVEKNVIKSIIYFSLILIIHLTYIYGGKLKYLYKELLQRKKDKILLNKVNNYLSFLKKNYDSKDTICNLDMLSIDIERNYNSKTKLYNLIKKSKKELKDYSVDREWNYTFLVKRFKRIQDKVEKSDKVLEEKDKLDSEVNRIKKELYGL